MLVNLRTNPEGSMAEIQTVQEIHWIYCMEQAGFIISPIPRPSCLEQMIRRRY